MDEISFRFTHLIMKKIYLENTTGKHNKFYVMIEIPNNKWVAKYGRIGNAPQRCEYGTSVWYRKYQEKLNKGYTEMRITNFSDNPILKKVEKLYDLVCENDYDQSDRQWLEDMIYEYQVNNTDPTKDELSKMNTLHKNYKQ